MNYLKSNQTASQTERRLLFLVFFQFFFLRLLAAWTQIGWAHPDEWFQTVELGNFIANGWMGFTEVVTLHHRNLTWPALLASDIWIAENLGGGLIWIKSGLIRSLMVFGELFALWGIWQWIQSQNEISFNKKVLLLGFAFLPWFMISDGVRPSQENISQISFWIAVGLYLKKRPSLAGFFWALTFVFRYPSGLLSLGAIAFVIYTKGFNSNLRKIILGSAVGFLLGGLSDLWIYGRFYESLWMYLQYNVWTTLGLDGFGTQSVWVYFEFFSDHWKGFLIPVGMLLAFAFVPGLTKLLKKRDLVVGAMFFYLLGHFLIGHKEPRFMFPVEKALILVAVYGLVCIFEKFKSRELSNLYLKVVQSAFVLILLVNFLFSIGPALGESFRKNGALFSLEKALEPESEVCAVVSYVRPLSLYMNRDSKWVWGFYPTTTRKPLTVHSVQLSDVPIIWLEKTPSCSAISSKVLIQLTRWDESWEQAGCEVTSFGLRSLLPVDKQNGLWAKCDSSLLLNFKNQESRRILITEIPKLDPLPGISTKADDLRQIMKNNRESSIRDAVMGDW